MKLKIKVTKEVIKQAMWCGTIQAMGDTARNCAVAIAIRDIFPEACVGEDNLYITERELRGIPIPFEAERFIQCFDNLRVQPEFRLCMNPMEFDLDIPNWAIDQINIEALEACPTMELVGD